MKLNKKQLIVGWGMILLIATLFINALFALPENTTSIVKIFIYLQIFIVIIGFSLIYVFRDKNK